MANGTMVGASRSGRRWRGRGLAAGWVLLVAAASVLLWKAPGTPRPRDPGSADRRADVASGAGSTSSVPSPSDFLGLPLGANGVLATYDQSADYWRTLARLSDRVSVEEIGKTTLGRPYLLAVVTAPENQARLEELRRANARLFDARLTSPAEARAFIRDGKVVVALQMGLHADEVGASQMALELGWRLATDQSERMRRVLTETILLISPSQNPDGMQMVAEWNARVAGTGYAGGPLPFLYHPYVGHDNNRDWYMLTQVESRLTVDAIWNRWHPQISADFHQLEGNGARIFVPPYLDPIDPHIDPLIIDQTNRLGRFMAARLLGQGKTGVVSQAIYDLWTPARAYVPYHGGVRLLVEVADTRLAGPREIDPSILRPGPGYDPRRASWNFPRPWAGGAWTLRDVIDYQQSAAEALLDHAARFRTAWLEGFWAVARRAVGLEKTRLTEDRPFAVVVPAEQPDPLAALEMLRTLERGGVEIQRARAPFQTETQAFAEGDYVMVFAQPASAYLGTLTSVQEYPEPVSAAREPYDATAYTLPLLMGVRLQVVHAPFAVDLEPALLASTPREAGRAESVHPGTRYTMVSDSAGMRVVVALLRAGVAVSRLPASGDSGQADAGEGRARGPWSAGSFLVAPDDARAAAAIRRAAGDWPVRLEALDGSVAAPARPVRLPRIGVYQSYLAPIDEGWTRWVLDEWGLPYETLHDQDVRLSAAPLRDRLDVVVLPDQPVRDIVEGIRPGEAPREYVGGIGAEGVDALREFVRAGGTAVALNRASALLLRYFDLPVRTLDEEGGRAPVYGPGTIVRARVNTDHPIGLGLPEESIVWFEQGPVLVPSGAARTVVSYPSEGPVVLSGWLRGGEALRGAAAAVEVDVGAGRVVLFGFRPQYRGQSWATFRLLFNALLSTR